MANWFDAMVLVVSATLNDPPVPVRTLLVPTRLIDMPGKLAVPVDQSMVTAPLVLVSVPVPWVLAMLMVSVFAPGSVVTGLLRWSNTPITGLVANVTPATVDAG